MHLHSSDSVSACYLHPVYAEDHCLDCEMNMFHESQKKLSSQESVLAEVLREKLVEKSKASDNPLMRFVGIGWVLASEDQIIGAFKKARHDVNAMAL